MFWRTLVLAVLWLEVQTQYTVNIGEKDHVYNTTLNESSTSIELHVDNTALQSARHGYLIIYPTAEYSYEVRSGAKGEEKLRCIGSRSTACVLNLDEEEHHLKSIKGYNIEIAMNCYGDCQGTLGVSVSQYLTSTHIGFTNIMLDDISELKVELNPTISNTASKLRLHAGGYSKKHDLHSLTLSCYGNAMKDEWPTATAHDFELKHIHGNELSHVIYSRDRFFCRNRSNCKYRLKCNTFAIYRIVLYAIEAASIEPVTEYESYVD